MTTVHDSQTPRQINFCYVCGKKLEVVLGIDKKREVTFCNNCNALYPKYDRSEEIPQEKSKTSKYLTKNLRKVIFFSIMGLVIFIVGKVFLRGIL